MNPFGDGSGKSDLDRRSVLGLATGAVIGAATPAAVLSATVVWEAQMPAHSYGPMLDALKSVLRA
jgi:hypothetical protein